MTDRRLSTGTDRYSRVAIAFHWTIAVLVIVNLAIGILNDSVLRWAFPVHKATGITVLVLTVARVAWRLGHRPPPLPADTPRWQAGVAHLTHWALYALLILMPLSGWAMSSGGPSPRPLTWYGLFPLPHLPVSDATADAGHTAHGVFGWLMLALVALHVGAALYHQFAMRDRLLGRMGMGRV